MAVKLFYWYDYDTKLCFLEFYRHLIESIEHNIEDFDSFKDKNFRKILSDLYFQKDNLTNIITLAL